MWRDNTCTAAGRVDLNSPASSRTHRQSPTRMVQPRTFRRMDLIEVRRQLVHARNRHSNNSLIVRRINGPAMPHLSLGGSARP